MDDPRYVKWLLVLPVTTILALFFVDVGYNDRLIFFCSILATYIGMIGWICVDWYRWKYNPTNRQKRVIVRRLYQIDRQTEIDKIPDCMVLSDLYFEQLALTRNDIT